MTEILQTINVIMIPIMIYIVKIEKRLTRIETILNGKRPKEEKK